MQRLGSPGTTADNLTSWMQDDCKPALTKHFPFILPTALISEPHKEIEDESGDVTVEVIMKDAISVEKDARLPAANRPKSPSTTHEALIMETVQLKTRNQELLAQLKKYEQRLALMEGHVHRLSRLAGEADDCVCALCTSFSLI